MARLLDSDCGHDDGFCGDLSDSTGCTGTSGFVAEDGDCCDASGTGAAGSGSSCSSSSGSGSGSSCHKRHHRHRHHHHHRLIPVGNIFIDCAPVSFATPGQARNVVSCAVSQTLMVPVTQTVNVQTPTSFGCFLCTPVTQTVQVPVTATVNLPPVLTPVPRLVCPPNAVCPQVSVPISSCGCGG